MAVRQAISFVLISISLFHRHATARMPGPAVKNLSVPSCASALAIASAMFAYENNNVLVDHVSAHTNVFVSGRIENPIAAIGTVWIIAGVICQFQDMAILNHDVIACNPSTFNNKCHKMVSRRDDDSV